jgi:hypothetical protein
VIKVMIETPVASKSLEALKAFAGDVNRETKKM